MAYFDFEPEDNFHSTWGPVVDVYESSSEIIVRVELPGVQRPDVQLRWRDGLLTITGMKQRQEAATVNGRFLCVERQYGKFRRDVSIQIPVDFRKSSAELRNGLLKIRLPKIIENPGDAYIPIDE
jgi:HSP20 family protein